MSPKRALAALALTVALGAGLVWLLRRHPASPQALRAEIGRITAERDALRLRIDELMERDPRLVGMPATPVRLSVPTSLLTGLVTKVAAGFVDQLRLELAGIQARDRGELKKLVTLGDYDLRVDVEQVAGRLRTGTPEVRFGGDRVGIALPVAVEAGAGRATLHFVWDGKHLTNAVCGDVEIRQRVSGRVRSDPTVVRGGVLLSATAQQILATPRFPPTRLRLRIEPAPESWAALEEILEQKEGVCGFVLDRIDVRGALEALLNKGILVRLPVEKIPAVALPVGIEPVIEVQGRALALAIRVGELAITERAVWLGGNVSVRPADGPARERRPEGRPGR